MGLILLSVGILGMVFFKEIIIEVLWNAVTYIWAKLDDLYESITK